MSLPPSPPPPPPPAGATPLPDPGKPVRILNTYDHERSRWGLGDSVVSATVFFAGSIALAFVVQRFASGDVLLPGAWLPFAVVAPAAAQFVHLVWVGRHKGNGLRDDFQLRFETTDGPLGLAMMLTALVSAAILAAILIPLLGEAPTAAATDIATESSGGQRTVWVYLFALLGATFIPLVEELVYRGLLWSALEKRGVGSIPTLLITSSLFAVAHLELTRTPVLLAIGLVLGYGRMATGRIGAPIVTHMLINTLAMVATLASF